MMRLVLVAALLVGCSKKKEDPGPSCDQVVDHMLDVTKQMLPGHGDQALGDRKAMIAQCEQRNMPAAQRKCLVAAKTLDELATCRRNETPSAGPPTPSAPPPSTPPPSAPTPSEPLPGAPTAPPTGTGGAVPAGSGS